MCYHKTMKFLALTLLLALASCASVLPAPDYRNVAKLWRADGGYGTAFPVAYAADGFYALTCWHVVNGADEDMSLDLDGIMYTGGVVIWTDEDADVALVGFKTTDRPWLYQLALVQPEAYTAGTVAGYPLGIEFLHVSPVLFQSSRNIVHGLTGPGGSGGPVFDQSGKVVGIVSRIRTPQVQTGFGAGRTLMGWIVEMRLLDTAREKLAELNAR